MGEYVSVGIDLGGRHCGVAVVRGNRSMSVLETSRQLDVPSKEPFWDRLSALVRSFRGLVPDRYHVLVFEAVRLYHHGHVSFPAIRDLARMQGVFGWIAHEAGAAVLDVHTRQWRSVVLGTGNADKNSVVKWALDFCRCENLGVDEAEAVALAQYGILWLDRKKSRRRSITTQRGGAHGPHSRTRSARVAVDCRGRQRSG